MSCLGSLDPTWPLVKQKTFSKLVGKDMEPRTRAIIRGCLAGIFKLSTLDAHLPKLILFFTSIFRKLLVIHQGKDNSFKTESNYLRNYIRHM